MPQRVLQPGEIESLVQRSVPRVRLPDRTLFARRATRLRALARSHALADYLELMAALADAQQAAFARDGGSAPDPMQVERARTHRMPPLPATMTLDPAEWRPALLDIFAAASSVPASREAIAGIERRVRAASPDWLEAQAAAAVQERADAIDLAVAPFVMAALQVHFAARAAAFEADRMATLDAPGVCPFCGSLPVASIVRAQGPWQGYRYLHCALCATEWHLVRIHCSGCGAIGKNIGYHTPHRDGTSDDGSAAVRAESCEQCRGYRKIVYQEKDPDVDPVADDLASVTLDLLLAEHDYHRLSGNPLLWQRATG